MNKIKNEKILYYFILVSAITGAWTVLPKYHKIYAFHILAFIYAIFLIMKVSVTYQATISKKHIKGYYVFLGLWYLYMLVTVFWSKSMFYYFKNLGIYTIMFYYLLILINNNQNIEELEKTIKIIAVCYIVSIFVGLLEGTTDFRLWGSPYLRKNFSKYSDSVIELLNSRPTAFFHNPNNFATFIFFGISFLLSYVLYSKNIKKIISYLSLIFISLIVLYLTDSRANLISVLLVFLIFILMGLKVKKIKTPHFLNFIIVMLSIILLIFLVFGYNPLTLNDEIVNILKMMVKIDFSDSKDASINFRVRVIKDALDTVKVKPFGVGCGNGQYIIGEIQEKNSALSLHNWFLEILLEFGIVFFVSYIIFYISLLINLYKCMLRSDINEDLKKIAGGCFFSLIGFLISMASPSGVIYFFPFWMVIGLALIVININRKTIGLLHGFNCKL